MKRKKKYKIKTPTYILMIFIIGIIIFGFYINNNKNSKNLYSSEAIKIIEDNKITNVYQKDYSKTLEEVLINNSFSIEYIEDYLIIEYRNEDDFIKNINEYLNIGYNGDEINNIYKLSNKNQEKILKLDKINNIEKYIDITNFNANNIKRYEDYQKTHKDLALDKIITYVNINLDKKFYTDVETETPTDYTTIVNKFHKLDNDYIPDNLVTVFDNKLGYKMVDVAEKAYEKFIEAATNDGFTFVSTTAYRSYSFQNTLYTNYVKSDGQELADTYSARPGYSEHQLGLAVDLDDPNYDGERLNDKDYEWVLNNSYKYGFIVRYPHDSEKITGYIEEPWHIRYLGVELATKVHESGLTYDEYYDLYLTEY